MNFFINTFGWVFTLIILYLIYKKIEIAQNEFSQLTKIII